jgi:hypothetical protein
MLPPLPELGSLRTITHIVIDHYYQDQHDEVRFQSIKSASKINHELAKSPAPALYGHTLHIEAYPCFPSGNKLSNRWL